MNYRHAYHAGNFADVLKHAVQALVIERLKAKDAAFRVIDTHAGVGIYDLSSDAAHKTGEWLAGIGRLMGPDAVPLPPAAADVLAPYLGAVRAYNAPGRISRYPGSPKVARAMLRPQDRLVVNELHTEDVAALRTAFRGDRQTKVMDIDGWVALKALLPPPERRGVVLIDPPFEVPGELERMADAIQAAVKRFATGVYLLWYPIKDRGPVRRFHQLLAASGIPRLMSVELMIRRALDPGLLNGTGLVLLNPPYGIEQQLEVLLPCLAERLASDARGSWSVDWIRDENGR